MDSWEAVIVHRYWTNKYIWIQNKYSCTNASKDRDSSSNNSNSNSSLNSNHNNNSLLRDNISNLPSNSSKLVGMRWARKWRRCVAHPANTYVRYKVLC